MRVWQGWFLPPAAIERYEAVMPGKTRRGQYVGFAVAGLAIAGSIFCAYLKEPVVACALLAVPALSVAKALFDSARAGPAKPVQGAPAVVPVSTAAPSP
jgi:hypothetical protein